MKLGFATFLVLMAAFSQSAAADRPHNIFDDDWAPPKPTQTPRPAPAVKPKPTPADPAPNVVPPNPPANDTLPATPAVIPAARLAIPASAAQASVRKVMKEVFADQLADRSIPARRKLTTALLAQVEKSKDAPVEQFVLLAAAVDSAIDAVNLPAAFRAADKMSETFDVDGLNIKADAALRVGPKSAVPDTASDNIAAAIELSNDLVRIDDFVTAVRVCTALQPAATTSAALRTQLQQRQRELTTAREAADHYARDLAKLAESPDDPAANLAVGRYNCLIKNDWETGLPMLAKSSNPALKATAAQELSRPSTAEEIVRVADAWWEMAGKQTDAATRAGITVHAAALYARAVDQITGLRKVQIEKRIAEAGKTATATPVKAAQSTQGIVNLLKLIDVKRDAVEGAWKIADTSGVESPAKGNTRLAIRYQPPEEYDFHIEFTRISGEPSIVQIFTDAGHRCVWLAGWGDRVRGFETVGGRDASSNSTSVKGPAISNLNQRYSSVVQVRKTGIAAYLDGKLVAECKTDGSDLGVKGRWNIGEIPLGLGGTGNDTIFHVVEIREITGHGKPIP